MKTLTAGELIELLARHPPDMPVYIYSPADGGGGEAVALVARMPGEIENYVNTGDTPVLVIESQDY